MNQAHTTSKNIAKQLNETDAAPIRQIEKVVDLAGDDFAKLMADAAVEVHQNEGLATDDGTRQRTLGGIFFYLVRGALPFAVRRQIFPPTKKAKQTQPSAPKRFEWTNRSEIICQVDPADKGKVESVNITIKGRPNTITRQDGVVIVTLEQAIPDKQTFPKGVPTPPNDVTTYNVYVGEQQWDKQVGTLLEDDADASLSFNGTCYLDSDHNNISVFVRLIKTHSLVEKAEKPKLPPQTKPRAPKPEKSPRVPVVVADDSVPDLSAYPTEVATKLKPLYGARRMFEKRLADIEALPEEKQSGLQAAKMMLERTQSQIDALEATHKPVDG